MRQILIAALLAASLASAVTFTLAQWNNSTAPTISHETAYQRVMRTGTIRCGYFVWPPYFNVDPATSAKSGIYYDIIEALGRSLSLKIDWTMEYTLGQQVEALRTNKIDALCADGPWTRSAMPYLDYSRPYMFIPGYVYVSKANSRITNYADYRILNDGSFRFTAMDGDGSADYLSELFPKAGLLSLPSTADPSQLIENVLTGKADAMLSDPATINEQSRERRDQLVQMQPDHALAVYPWVVSVAKDQQSFVNLINQGLDLLTDTGIAKNILEHYDTAQYGIYLPQPRYQFVHQPSGD